MDTELFAALHDDLPKFNPLLAQGYAVEQLKHVESYLDRVIQCVSKDFPEGLEYLGCARVPPDQEFKFATQTRSNKSTLQFARSYTYLMEYIFQYKGERKSGYFYLIYGDEAGQTLLQNSKFMVNPVLTDPAISESQTSVFVPLNRHRLNFKRMTCYYVADGRRQEMAYVMWGQLYNNEAAKGKIAGRATNLMHYLFAKYGMPKVMNQMFGIEYIVRGIDQDYGDIDQNEWQMCESLGRKPPGFRGQYFKPGVRLFVKRSNFLEPNRALLVHSIVASFFHTADLFPSRFFVEDVEGELLWRRMLGYLLFGETEAELSIIRKVNTHIGSLDGYIDQMVKEQLKDIGVLIDNLWEFLAYGVEHFPKRMAQSSENIAEMRGKKLTVLRYVLSENVSAINHMLFALTAAQAKGITKEIVQSCISDAFRPKTIVRINRNGSEVVSVSSASDCYIHKLTSNVVMQTASGQGRFTASQGGFDESHALHVDVCQFGSITNLPKRNCSGRGKLNMFARVRSDGTLIPDPEREEMFQLIQEQIKR